MSRDIYRAGPLTVTRFAGSVGTALQLTPTTAGGYIVITDPMVAIELAAALELWGRTEETRRRTGGGEYRAERCICQGGPRSIAWDPDCPVHGGDPSNIEAAQVSVRVSRVERQVMDQAQALARLEQDIRGLDRVCTEGRGDLTNYIRELQNGAADARHERRRLGLAVGALLDAAKRRGEPLPAVPPGLDPARFCTRPDVDVPGLVCGHPLPCPRHLAGNRAAADASPGPGEAPG